MAAADFFVVLQSLFDEMAAVPSRSLRTVDTEIVNTFAAFPRGTPAQRRAVCFLRLLAVGLFVCIASGCAVRSSVLLPDTPAASSPELNMKMFDRVDELVRTRHYSPTLNGVDWPALRERYRPQVAAAVDQRAAYRSVNAMLGQLHDSHTRAERPGRKAGGHARALTINPTEPPGPVATILADGMVYVRFDTFDSTSAHWLKRQVAAHRDAPGMIVDLRDNTGGLIVAAQHAIGLFFDRKVEMGIVIHRSGRRSIERSRSWWGAARFSGRVVVLVGSNSFSSAEVFAYVMQHHERAMIVGETTAGEVLGSRRFRLPDGGNLQLSVTDYRRLDGERLEDHGVHPDVVLPSDLVTGRAVSDDPAVATALQMLRAPEVAAHP